MYANPNGATFVCPNSVISTVSLCVLILLGKFELHGDGSYDVMNV